MPTYSYHCPKCGHDYAKLQNISNSTRAKCPKCGTRGERQITGGGGFHFKGTGFYATDYKKKEDKADKSEKAEKPETKEPAKTETKTPDKPAAKKKEGDSKG